jgi:hypothetical protein
MIYQITKYLLSCLLYLFRMQSQEKDVTFVLFVNSVSGSKIGK